MNMRIQAVVLGAAIAVSLLSPHKLLAGFIFTAQNRSISTNAQVAYFGFPPEVDSHSTSAPDFSNFNDSRSASVVNTQGQPPITFMGQAMATGSQNSQLGSSLITAAGSATGSVSAVQHDFFECHAIGNSLFSSTFTIDAPTAVEISYQLFVQINHPLMVDPTTAQAAFSLTGGTTNLTAATSIPFLGKDNTVQSDQVLFLASGTYVLSATAMLDTVHSGAVIDSGAGNANFSISIAAVPEPSTLLLSALGALGLLFARQR